MSADAIRAFIRAHATDPGALDALDALQALEAAATTTAEEIAREREYAAALHDAQQAARSAVKDSNIDLKGGKGYSVAETEQLIQIARDAIAPFGLSIATGGAEIVLIGNAPFLRSKYGVRHRRGYVEWSFHDFPVDLKGGGTAAANARRGAATSNLGYYLRDVLLLERKDDESERHAARGGDRRSSGPNRVETRRPQLGPRAQEMLARIMQKESLDGLDTVEGYLADQYAAHESPSPDAPPALQLHEIDELMNAARRRREALAASPEGAGEA